MNALRKISMTRKDDWGGGARFDPTKPFQTTVEVQGPMGKIELTLPPEVSSRIVAVIAEELAAAARRVAEEMTASFVVGETLVIEAR